VRVRGHANGCTVRVQGAPGGDGGSFTARTRRLWWQRAAAATGTLLEGVQQAGDCRQRRSCCRGKTGSISTGVYVGVYVSVWLCLPGKTDVVRHRFCEATDAFLGGLRDWLHV